MLANILPIEDKEVSETLEKSFKKRGINILTKTKVTKVEVKNSYVNVFVEKDGKQIEIKADKVLSAIGVTGYIFRDISARMCSGIRGNSGSTGETAPPRFAGIIYTATNSFPTPH